jgi:hypothetical protein
MLALLRLSDDTKMLGIGAEYCQAGIAWTASSRGPMLTLFRFRLHPGFPPRKVSSPEPPHILSALMSLR